MIPPNTHTHTFTMITKIDHLGIAVKSLDESIPYYENVLGLHCEGREEVESQKVRTAFFAAGDVHLELLEPTSDDSPIAKFLEKNGPAASTTSPLPPTTSPASSPKPRTRAPA